MPQDQNQPQLTITEADLKNQCYRLNRRLQLMEDAIASKVTTPAQAAPALTTPVDITNLNVDPGKKDIPAIKSNPAVHYGPRSLRESGYPAQYHEGELFIETDGGYRIFQSQDVQGTSVWVQIM